MKNPQAVDIAICPRARSDDLELSEPPEPVVAACDELLGSLALQLLELPFQYVADQRRLLVRIDVGPARATPSG